MTPTQITSMPQLPGANGEHEVGPEFEFSEEDIAILLAAILPALPESERGREVDCVAWWRVLPRLLAEGEEGRYAMIHQGQLVSIWDTHGDAIQAGYDKFGVDAKIFAGPIKQRELSNWRRFLAQERAKQCPK